jgi:Fic family protein
LGLEIAGLVASDRNVDGVVEMSLDAARNYTLPLTEERLFRWHKLLFPGGGTKLAAGAWRNDAAGPMQVVSGAIGRERVHYEAPPAAVLPAEMAAFLEWANRADAADPVLRAAIMHLWFVTLHPFGDGNGRIARVIADWGLARAENTERRFYSVSAQMRAERRAYYDVLERAHKGTLDITAWLLWFLGCLDRALQGAEASLAGVFRAERFWRACDGVELNERQRLMLGRLLEGFSGRLTSTKWAAITRCSQDTAQRDIQALLDKGIMLKAPGGGRNTSYLLREPG